MGDTKTCIAFYHLCMALMASAFMMQSMNYGSGISPELYGGAIYSIPAICWGLILLSSSIMVVYSTVSASLFSRIVGVLGAFISFLIYITIGALAGMAEQGTIVQYLAVFVAMPISVATICYLIKGCF